MAKKEENNNVKKVLLKALGYICLLIALMVFSQMFMFFSWQLKKDNYNKEYVYSLDGNLYYTKNGKNIYVKEIYDTSLKSIKINIPDKKTVLMYCEKDNNRSCIYFDVDDPDDKAMINPLMCLFGTMLFLSFGVFCLNYYNYSYSHKLDRIYVFYLLLFLGSVGIIIYSVARDIKYNSLKKNGEKTVATLYSEIYKNKTNNETFKPVYYYYVDGNRYIYVNDVYIDGNVDSLMGKNYDIYYEKDNPSNSIIKEEKVDLEILICAIVLLAFSTPIVLFKKKLELRLS